MLRTSLTKPTLWMLPLIALSLTGCGLTQCVTDGTKSAFNSMFYKQIKVLHLDFTAREALDPNKPRILEAGNNSLALLPEKS